MPQMTKCKACNETISKAAITCPKCGNPNKKPHKGFFDGCGTAIVIILLLLIVIALFGGSILSGVF